MTDEKIKLKLMKEKLENKRILKELVEKRILETHKDKFDLQEIYRYSKYFNVTISRFLLEILEVTRIDYNKFIDGKLKYIKSDRFLNQKCRYIKRERTKFKYTINWNVKNYYNKEKLIKRAKTYKMNAFDFSTGVLQKSKKSARNVLNDENGTRRLYIGKYVNKKLPEEFFSKYYNELKKMIKIVIRKISHRRGKKLQKDEFEEELQKGLVYLFEYGNNLDKFNRPIIQKIEHKNHQQKRMFWKSYYYMLQELYNTNYNLYYIENIKYDEVEEKNQDDENCIKEFIDSLSLNQKQERILHLINAGYDKSEIIEKEKITESEYENVMEDIRNIITYVNS